MIQFLLRRILYNIPVLFVVAFFMLLLFHKAGGDPTTLKLGKNPTQAQYKALEHEMGLDKSFFPGQYVDFLEQIATFDFGKSWVDDTPVRRIFMRGLVPTLSLSIPAFVLGALIAIALALFVAFYRGAVVDRSLTAMAICGISISSLIYILVGQWLLAYELRNFPIWGYEYGFSSVFFLALPISIWILLSIGTDMRYFRTVALEEIQRDYVRTARSKGLTEVKVLFTHVLRNCAIPIVTRLTIIIPFLITGSFLLEIFFGIPGLGSTLFTAITNHDLPVVKAFTMLGAVLYIIFNILADVLYGLFDPRMRLA